jgi:hypothetical protein
MTYVHFCAQSLPSISLLLGCCLYLYALRRGGGTSPGECAGGGRRRTFLVRRGMRVARGVERTGLTPYRHHSPPPRGACASLPRPLTATFYPADATIHRRAVPPSYLPPTSASSWALVGVACGNDLVVRAAVKREGDFRDTSCWG